MGIDAVAVVRIPFEVIRAGFEALPHDPDAERAGMHPLRAAHGGPFLARPLEDATLVWTFARIHSAPDEIGLALRRILGGLLDRHADPRGVLVYPDVAEPRARRYDELVAEIGDACVWAPIVARDHVPESLARAEPGSVGAHLRDLMAAIPPDVLAEAERAARSGEPDRMAQAKAAIERLMEASGGQEKWLEALQLAIRPPRPGPDGTGGGGAS